MAERFGLLKKSKPPSLYSHLSTVYRAVNRCRETGWYQWGLKVPLIEIQAAFKAYGFIGDFEYFIDLFRTCEKTIDERRHTENSGDKNRPDSGETGP